MASYVRTIVGAGQPGRQHFDLWREALVGLAVEATITSPYVADFNGSIEATSLGGVSTLLTDSSTITIDRTPSQIRRSDPEAFLLLVNLTGIHRVCQDRDEAVLTPGDMVLVHTSQVLRSETVQLLPRQRGLVVACEGLEIPPGDLSRLVGQRLAGTEGVGRLVSGYLETLASAASSLAPADALRLSSVTTDLLTVMLGRRLGVLHRISPERRDRERFVQISRFIRHHLGDPDLSPEVIARAHHISVRTLHRIFGALAGTSVSRWMRERRLEGYRADLLDPALRTWSVQSIALRWGLTDPSHVSRAFKQTYGLSPGAYRELHGGLPGNG